jgi:PilZ domain-containing protein
MDITELRAAERFRTAEPLPGSFGAASIALLDISLSGAQIEHSQPLRLGTLARLAFKRGEVAVTAQARTMWSHLSKSPNGQGKYLYHSGVRLEAKTIEYDEALRELLEHGDIEPDRESLERKKRKELERTTEKNTRPIVKYLKPEVDVPPDQQLMIEQARKQLAANPDEAQRWYQRAKYAITHGTANLASDDIRNREDVLAVWEYLERSVEISSIARVFERMRTSH